MATKNKKQKSRSDRSEKDKKVIEDCGDYCEVSAAQVCSECLEWSRYCQALIENGDNKGGQ